MSLTELIPKIPGKTYNALFTPEGRKSLRYRLKKCRANLSADYRQKGLQVYPLKSHDHFVLHRGNRLSELVFLEGAYEPLETLIVSQVVKSGDVVLDVGANVGYYTALLDKLVKPGGQVHSFEPGQGTFGLLQETKSLLNLVHTFLYPKAVSDQVGTIDFFLSTSGSDAQQSTVKNAALGQGTRRQSVEATSLDAFVAALNQRAKRTIAFVKCDIEGAELSMLKGAKGLVNSDNPPVWLIEHNREALLEHGAGSKDLVAQFSNYDVYFVPMCWPPSVMVSRQATRWNGVADDLPAECNLIIFPKTGSQSKRAEALKQSGLLPK